jgi:hypothetical protein
VVEILSDDAKVIYQSEYGKDVKEFRCLDLLAYGLILFWSTKVH